RTGMVKDAPRLAHVCKEDAPAPFRFTRFAGDLDEEREPFLRRQDEVERGTRRVEVTRCGVEADAGLAQDAIQTLVAEGHRAATQARRRVPAAARSTLTANLEDVGEVRGEVEVEPYALRTFGEIEDGDAL